MQIKKRVTVTLDIFKVFVINFFNVLTFLMYDRYFITNLKTIYKLGNIIK